MPSFTLAVQMDALDGLDIAGDTTLALLEAALQRGYHVWHYTPGRLTLDTAGRVTAAATELLAVDTQATPFYQTGETRTLNLADMDIVLMRQDPPFDLAYITATHLLERLPDSVRVINPPGMVRNYPEKLWATAFPDLTPPTVITGDPSVIRRFHAEQGDIVLKPLYAHGGQGVFHLRPNDPNLGSTIALLHTHYSAPLIAQRFLPEVRNGDIRVLLADGEIAGAVRRIPAEHDIRANLCAGGNAVEAVLEQREHTICRDVGEALKEKGLFFAGIDLIGGYLTEINLTSPTGVRQANQWAPRPIEDVFWEKLGTLCRR